MDTHDAPTFDIAGISAALGPLACRFDIDVIAECDSTNQYLMTRAEAGAPSGSVLIARHQTAGRGRRGRRWISEPGASLTFSIFWRFPKNTPLDGLSLAIGVALAQGLASLGVSDITLKWPNDVLLKRRKLAGILIEWISGRPMGGVIIGIGMNLHRPRELPDDCLETTAALDETGLLLPSHNALLAGLLDALHACLILFEKHGLAGFRSDWQAKCAHINQPVQILSDLANPLDGLCRGIADDGSLYLETVNGSQRIISGDVSLRNI